MVLSLVLGAFLSAAAIEPKPDSCPVPADLPATANATYVAPADTGGADLAPSGYRVPDKIEIPLRLYLPPPAPFGTQAELGVATLDTRSGVVEFGGADALGAPGIPIPAGRPGATPPGQSPPNPGPRDPTTNAPLSRDCR